tara:strand:+ start:75 stop:623 length:549 start_codon:yes stop_codon:yes gene_type:complete
MTAIYNKLPIDIQGLILENIYEKVVRENTCSMIKEYNDTFSYSEKWDQFNELLQFKTVPSLCAISPDDILAYKNKTYSWTVTIRVDFASITNEFVDYADEEDPLGEYFMYRTMIANESITYGDVADLLNDEFICYTDFLDENDIPWYDDIDMEICEIDLIPYADPTGEYDGYYDLKFKTVWF